MINGILETETMIDLLFLVSGTVALRTHSGLNSGLFGLRTDVWSPEEQTFRENVCRHHSTASPALRCSWPHHSSSPLLANAPSLASSRQRCAAQSPELVMVYNCASVRGDPAKLFVF